MQDFSPGLLDKLFAENRHKEKSSESALIRLSLEELKDSVASDLESLLNTRKVISEMQLKRYPECAKSIVTYGLNDFAGLSLASTDDRAFICKALEQAITRHEPRLKNVKASIDIESTAINKLNFAISALLVVNPISEPVSFDAVLRTSSLHYSINKARRKAGLPVYG
jgi:type VI secretion system protein ImpF